MLPNASCDQAEGLRRILAGNSARQLCFLSAVTAPQKNAVLLNLAAALVRAGSEVQVLDASLSEQGVSSRATPALQTTLWEVAQQSGTLQDAVREHEQGIRLARLAPQALSRLHSQANELDSLSRVLREMSPNANFWLIDADIQADNPFVLPELSASEVVVLVANTPTSIKNAYTEMKEFQGRFGRLQYHLLVLGASAAQAQMITRNMALTASRYLDSRPLALGHIPADGDWARAVQLGRAIVDAFPMAAAAIAFREVAAHLVSAGTQAPRQPVEPVHLTPALEV